LPSTITTPVVGRVPNHQVAQLRQLARQRNTTVSKLIAGAVADKLAATTAADTPKAAA
jgi:hypothetical protein